MAYISVKPAHRRTLKGTARKKTAEIMEARNLNGCMPCFRFLSDINATQENNRDSYLYTHRHFRGWPLKKYTTYTTCILIYYTHIYIPQQHHHPVCRIKSVLSLSFSLLLFNIEAMNGRSCKGTKKYALPSKQSYSRK